MEHSTFEIRRRRAVDTVSLKVTAAAVRGLAFGYGADAETAGLADVDKFVGFLTQKVTANGETLQSLLVPSSLLETDIKAGAYAELDPGVEEVDIEDGATSLSGLLVLASTGAISGSTAVDVGLNWDSGRLRVAQLGESFLYRVAAQLTPVNAGDVRIKVVYNPGTNKEV